jgi:uncharacterized protein
VSGLPPHLVFTSRAGRHLYLSQGSQLFDIEGEREFALGDSARYLPAAPRRISPPPPQHLSLNVSTSCNLACGYCYAGQGGFGGAQDRAMDFATARAAIDQLLAGLDRSRPATLGFIGGEPFVARRLIHEVVAYGAEAARREGIDLRYSVTTNATLLTPEDHALLRRHLFAVTVSIDGGDQVHDAQRPARGGRGSWARAVAGIAPLLAEPGHARIAARATVTQASLDLVANFDALRAAGFTEIGFAPLRRGPAGSAAITGAAWVDYREALIALARRELADHARGLPIRLTNLAVALKEIARGAASPYPCGAGAGYFSVSADGDWYACHRAIGEAEFRLGDSRGLDTARREAFLLARHVDAQSDCNACWARSLCSGGCHQEKAERSLQSCDFIRGWLAFCLAAYCELGSSDGTEESRQWAN